MGITKGVAWVQQTPMGETVLVYWEVEDSQRAHRQMAESQDQFDVWFRQFTQNVHGMDITGGAAFQRARLRLGS